MGRGRKRGTGDESNKGRTYFKVFATFQCSKDNCGKVWRSAHGWDIDDGGSHCSVCEKQAALINAVDQMLKLDTFHCQNQSCDKIWQGVHDEKRLPQECDCGAMVTPGSTPQERFGRQYTFQCKNKTCTEKPGWTDFSIENQKGQRCTKCNSRGDIKKVQKLWPRALLEKRRLDQAQKNGGTSGTANGGGGALPNGGGFVSIKGPSKHISEFCDMCQAIIRQGKGTSCHQYRRVVSKLKKDTNNGGGVVESIVHVSAGL